MHLYEGKPVYPEACTHWTLDEGDHIWRANFKGPLFGYIKSRDQHFIPYSPQWVYEWVKSLADDGKRLWFVCHCIAGLFSFDDEKNVLNHYCGYAGYPLPDGEGLTHQDDGLVFHTLNSSYEPGDIIVIENFDDLMECRPRFA